MCRNLRINVWVWVGAGGGGWGRTHTHTLVRVATPPLLLLPPARPLARLHGSAVPVREPSLRQRARTPPPPAPGSGATPFTYRFTGSSATSYSTVYKCISHTSKINNIQHNEETAHFSQRAPSPPGPAFSLPLSLCSLSDVMRLCRVRFLRPPLSLSPAPIYLVQ